VGGSVEREKSTPKSSTQIMQQNRWNAASDGAPLALALVGIKDMFGRQCRTWAHRFPACTPSGADRAQFQWCNELPLVWRSVSPI
jgi:hypothetical protein